MYTGEKGMEKNDMLELARETRKKIREVFTDKVDTITAYDIHDDPNHRKSNGITCRNIMDSQSQLREGTFGMQLNKTEEMAVQTSRMIRKLFGDKMSGSVIYDVIDESNHHTFKLKFRVYNFAGVKFQYENDFFEIYLFLNGEEGLLISKPNSRYSEISDWDAYLKEIMVKIESYIPEKYLKAKGWR